MARESRHRLTGSFLSRSRLSARPLLESLEVRLAPAGFTVDHGADDGLAGSLRDCISKANTSPGFDTITLETTQPITLASQLKISDTVAITGGPGLSLIQRDPANAAKFGLFDITASAGNVTFSNLELTGGHTTTDGGAVSNAAKLSIQNCWVHGNVADGNGGGIFSANNLDVNASTFQDDQAVRGGGVYVENTSNSSLTIDFLNSTFVENLATAGNGGALATSANFAAISAEFIDCTLADNDAAGGLGGAYAYASEGSQTRFTYQGSLFARNSATNLGGEGIDGENYVLTSLGFNLSTDSAGMSAADVITADPRLGFLGFYGGPTPTLPLLPGSPAIDKGTSIAGISTDQRGVSRQQGAAPDIGAFEVRPQALVLAGNDQFTHIEEAFTRTGSISGDGDAQVFVYFGDEQGEVAPTSFGFGPSFTLSHAYADEGTYEVLVMLIDSTGRVLDTRTFEIDVFLDSVPLDEAVKAKPLVSTGTATATTTDPTDGSSVSATLTHPGLGPNAAIIVAVVPDALAARLNGSSQIDGRTITSAFDVRAVHVAADDIVTIVFHYYNDDFDLPVLRYYDRATNQERVVDTSLYVVDPVARTITLTIDKNSHPGILNINGTVFTIAVPLPVSVAASPSPSAVGLTPDATTVSTLLSVAHGGGSGAGSSDGSVVASSQAQITGGSIFFALASFTTVGRRPTDESFGDSFSTEDGTNLLAELPVVPSNLITLPGPILTPGSAEMPLPREPSNTIVSPDAGGPATGGRDDGADDPDEVFADFDGGRLRSRLDAWDEPLPEWRDMTLAAAAVLALRPPVPRRRRSMTNTPDER